MRERDKVILKTAAVAGSTTVLLSGCDAQTVFSAFNKAAMPVFVVSVGTLIYASVRATKQILAENKKELANKETEKYIQDYQTEFKE